MTAWEVVGTVLEALGLLIAIRGVLATYRTIVGEPMAERAGGQFTRWFRRRILRRPPDTIVGSASATFGPLTMSGYGIVRPGDPGPDAPLDDQLVYLRASVSSAFDTIISTHQWMVEADRVVENRVTARVDQTEERLTALRGEVDKVKDGAFGPDGAGLRETAVGLGVTLVGALLPLLDQWW